MCVCVWGALSANSLLTAAGSSRVVDAEVTVTASRVCHHGWCQLNKCIIIWRLSRSRLVRGGADWHEENKNKDELHASLTSFQCKRKNVRTHSRELCLHIWSCGTGGHICVTFIDIHAYVCVCVCVSCMYMYVCTGASLAVASSCSPVGSMHIWWGALAWSWEGYLPCSYDEGGMGEREGRGGDQIKDKGEVAEGLRRWKDGFSFIKWDENKQIFNETPGDELRLSETRKEVENPSLCSSASCGLTTFLLLQQRQTNLK